MNLTKIGKNIELSDLYIDSNNCRYVLKDGVKKQEKNKTLEFGYISNQVQYEILLTSLLNPVFFQSYGRDLKKIYQVWFQGVNNTNNNLNQSNSNSLSNNKLRNNKNHSKNIGVNQLNQNRTLKQSSLTRQGIGNFKTNEKENDVNSFLVTQSQFIQDVKNQMRDYFYETWIKELKRNTDVDWMKWMLIENQSKFPIGIQYGLSQFLLKKDYKKARFLELGLQNALNSSILSSSIPNGNKTLYCLSKEQVEYSPYFKTINVNDFNVFFNHYFANSQIKNFNQQKNQNFNGLNLSQNNINRNSDRVFVQQGNQGNDLSVGNITKDEETKEKTFNYSQFENLIRRGRKKFSDIKKESLIEAIENDSDISISTTKQANNKEKNYQEICEKLVDKKTIKIFWGNLFENAIKESVVSGSKVIVALNKEQSSYVNLLQNKQTSHFLIGAFLSFCKANNIHYQRRVLINQNSQNNTNKDGLKDFLGEIWFFNFHKTTNFNVEQDFKQWCDGNIWQVDGDLVNQTNSSNQETTIKNANINSAINIKNGVHSTSLSLPLSIKIKTQKVAKIGEREYYQPISNKINSNAMVSSKIANEITDALLKVKKEYGDLNKWIANLLKISEKELLERLSPEQIDAISLGVQSLLNKKGLIIADETGFGKGRILASIALIGLLKGKTIIFFTENKQLFSDFYRDILAIYPETKIKPLLLNQMAGIYDPNGNLVIPKYKKQAFKDMINNKVWDKNDDRFIITNYAQINKVSKKNKKNEKVEFLKRLQGEESWVILDEAHNASGNSNIYENLQSLCDKAEGVIFSSATYAKTEEKLKLYEKALPLSSIAQKLVKMSLFGDTGDLRELLTKEMAKQGNFIRREHTPIDLPQYLFVENSSELKKRLELFSSMWKAIFELVEHREKMLGNFSAKAWLTIGSVLSRSIREFAFLSKIDDLVKFCVDKVNQNEKVVIVTEITFESTLKSLIDNEIAKLNDGNLDETIIDMESEYEDEDRGEDREDKRENESENHLASNNNDISKSNDFDLNNAILIDGYDDKKDKINTCNKFTQKPNWNVKWLALLDDLTNEEKLNLEAQKEMNKNKNFDKEAFEQMKDRFFEKKKYVEKIILQNDYYDLSPLDDIKAKLAQHNIPMSELSARKHRLFFNEEEKVWEIDSKNIQQERIDIVNSFNNGSIDVMLLTRAGASGISLHAGEKFKDKKVRNLIELDIATNSANRIQFWGRVRRRDQVVEPNFYTLLLKQPSDIRKIEIEKRKQRQLNAHTGGRKEENGLDWISKEGELIVEEWTKERREYAKQLGCLNSDDEKDTYKIEKLLNRALIMPIEEQESLFNRLDLGIKTHENFYFYENNLSLVSKTLYKEFYWGNPVSKTQNEIGNSLLNLNYITLNCRLWYEENDLTNHEKQRFLTKLKNIPNFIKENSNKTQVFLTDCENQLQKKQENKDINSINYATSVLKNIKLLFKDFSIGDTFNFRFKNGLIVKKGVLLDVVYDFDNIDNLKSTLTQLSLNTISLKVLFKGDLKALQIPLLHFFDKKYEFQKLFKQFNLNDFSSSFEINKTNQQNPVNQNHNEVRKGFVSVSKNNNLRSDNKNNLKEDKVDNFNNQNQQLNSTINAFTSITLEGNPILLSIWRKKMKMGKVDVIFDKEEGSKTILVLPKKTSLTALKELDKPFFTIGQIMSYFKDNRKGEIYNVDKNIKIQRDERFAYVVYKEKNHYLRYRSKWILKAHKFIEDGEMNGYKSLRVKMSQLSKVLSLMEGDGIYFLCSNHEWFNQHINDVIEDN